MCLWREGAVAVAARAWQAASVTPLGGKVGAWARVWWEAEFVGIWRVNSERAAIAR